MDKSVIFKSHPYVFCICEDMVQWDRLVDESPQGHVFSSSAFLKSLKAPHTCYTVCTLQGQLLAGVAIMRNGSEMIRAPFEFSPHQGIIFSNYISTLSNHKRLSLEFKITIFLIESLLENFTNFSMALSPFFRDLRPFLWHNYGAKNAALFKITQRYTAYLPLSTFELSNYLQSVRSVRRQEYKKSNVILDTSDDLDSFMNLYIKTFKRQGINVEKEMQERIRSICTNALNEGYGYLNSAKIDGCAVSMAFFLSDRSTAYYLFGVNDPEYRNYSVSSKLLIDSIAYFASRGLKWFDFVGVNSPNRGDFKLSFNADLIAYQEVHLTNQI